MRTYPHKPTEGDLREVWQRILKRYQNRTEAVDAAIRERKKTFCRYRCIDALELACFAYAFESPIAQVRQLLAEACEWAERAVEFGVELDSVLYMEYLSLAILSRKEGFRKNLEALRRHQYTNPNIGEDEIFYLAAESMAALSSNRVAAAQEITTRALIRARSGQVDKLARAVMEPVLLMESAVANKEPQSLEFAAESQSEKLRATYSQKAAKMYPNGLLDVRGVAMLALAHQYGLQAIPSNVYMPRELFEENA